MTPIVQKIAVLTLILFAVGGAAALAQTPLPPGFDISQFTPTSTQGTLPAAQPEFVVPEIPLPTIVEPLSLTARPGSPAPGQKVTVTADTPTADPLFTTFTWSVNGAVQRDASGRGKNTITVTAPQTVGGTMRVSATATFGDGKSSSASLTLRVSDLVIAWIAETYTPRWYRGKALPTPQSIVRFVALPNFVIDGQRLSPENLVYRWNLDDEGTVSEGRGAQIFRLKISDVLGNTHNVRVTIEDSQKRIRKVGDAFITIMSPEAAVYASSPLGGIEPRRALATLATNERGTLDFQIEPFYYPVASRRALTYQWNIASAAPQGTAEKPEILTVSTDGELPGVIPFSVTVRSAALPLVPITKTFNLWLQ